MAELAVGVEICFPFFITKFTRGIPQESLYNKSLMFVHTESHWSFSCMGPPVAHILVAPPLWSDPLPIVARRSATTKLQPQSAGVFVGAATVGGHAAVAYGSTSPLPPPLRA